jgi:chromosome partitioning protein
MPRIIAIANQKGGTGKTTTAINLVSGLARLSGQKVLLIDIDPHANTTAVFFGARYVASPNSGLTIYEVLMNRAEITRVVHQIELEANDYCGFPKASIDILPSHFNLASAELELVSIFQRENRLREALKPVKNTYHYMVIDCPPNLGLLTVNALMAATEVLIPVEPGYFPLLGLGLLNQTIQTVAAANDSLRIMGVLPVRMNRTNLAISTIAELKSAFGDRVLPLIPERIAIGEAHAQNQDIFSYARSGDGLKAYANLAREVMSRDQASG